MFQAISQVFPPIYLPKEQKILTYDKYGNKLYFKESKIDRNTEFFAGSFRVSLFIDLGCPRDLGKEWRGDLGTFMISRPI